MGRPCLGAGAPDDAETARRCHAVAAVALPWIVSVLDVQGGSSSALTQDALVLLLLAWQHRHTDSDFEDGDEAVLTQIANSIVRMLDAHGRDAGVVEAGLALLAELARNEWGNVTSQVRGGVVSLSTKDALLVVVFHDSAALWATMYTTVLALWALCVCVCVCLCAGKHCMIVQGSKIWSAPLHVLCRWC